VTTFITSKEHQEVDVKASYTSLCLA